MSAGGNNEYDERKLFVGGLSWDTTEASLRDYFSKFGKVQEVSVKLDKVSQKPRGFGFVKFEDESCIPGVLCAQEHVLDGKKIDPKLATAKSESPEKTKVFVGGIPPLAEGLTMEVLNRDLQELLENSGCGQYGIKRIVTEVEIKIDKQTGRHRGFGFVTFSKPEDAAAVCQTKFFPFKGKNIEIKIADPRQNRQGGGGYAGGQMYYPQQQSQHQQWAGGAYHGSGTYDYTGSSDYSYLYNQQYPQHQGGSSGGQMPGYENYSYSHGSTRGDSGASGYGQSYSYGYGGHQSGHAGYGTQTQQQSGYYGHPTPQPPHN